VKCFYHWQRKGVEVKAERVIDGTPMCKDCYNGKPIFWSERLDPLGNAGEKETRRRNKIAVNKWQRAYRERKRREKAEAEAKARLQSGAGAAEVTLFTALERA